MSPEGKDRIFNGAVDNATGCAMLLEFARAWAAMVPRPRRTAIFVAVTGEESGLRGSEYYVRNPLLPLSAARLNINVDGISPGGRPGGLLALGEDKTKAWPLIEEAARRFALPLRPDPRPEAGSAFRSDHFSFVRAGVSAFSLIPVDVPGAFAAEYNRKHYHQPTDEYSPDWDMTSNEAIANLAMMIGVNAASRP
jgi:Zn-dependent M28 family amino/carboxypeptidase